MRILEWCEAGDPQELTQEQWDAGEAECPDCWKFTGRVWQIDEDTRVFEYRSDRNMLSVKVELINEAAWSESLNEGYAVLTTAFHLLNTPKGGNF